VLRPLRGPPTVALCAGAVCACTIGCATPGANLALMGGGTSQVPTGQSSPCPVVPYPPVWRKRWSPPCSRKVVKSWVTLMS
jgi:hypothetical protein